MAPGTNGEAAGKKIFERFADYLFNFKGNMGAVTCVANDVRGETKHSK
jgi:hypothetical protein